MDQRIRTRLRDCRLRDILPYRSALLARYRHGLCYQPSEYEHGICRELSLAEDLFP